MTPRVTYDGDIILEITRREQRARPGHATSPARTCRRSSRARCTTKLRLRDGESNLLAGLLREDERKSLTGFPGVMRLPIVKQLFSANDNTIKQTDIVMLLTPRIIRTHDLRAQDLSPIYIGTQSNMSLTGPPATIGGAPEPVRAAAGRSARRAMPGDADRAVDRAGGAADAAVRRTQPPAAPVLPTGSTQRPSSRRAARRFPAWCRRRRRRRRRRRAT